MASLRRIPGQVARKPRPRLSWGQIALIVAALVGGLFGFAAWRAIKAVDAEIARWSNIVSIERGSVVLGPTGRIGIDDLVLRAAGASGDVPRVTVESARITAGGAFSVFRALITGAEPGNSVPLRIELTNVAPQPGTDPVAGGLFDRYVLFPFDFAGCGTGQVASIAALPGIAEGRVDIDVYATRKGEEADIRLSGTSHEIADLLLELRLDGVSAGGWAQGLRGARLRGARFDVLDHGFASARNRHCAVAQNIDEAAALERHIAGVREWFATRYVEPAPPLLGAYRRLAEQGGTLEVNLRPRRPLPLAAFANMPLRDFSVSFGGTARVEGMVPATLALTPLALPPGVAEAAAPADGQLVQLSAAAEVAGASPSAVPGAIRFNPGQRLEFEDLAGLVGATITVTSDLGVTRRGKLAHYTRAGIEVELDTNNGGFRMSMPRSSLRSIVLVSNPPLEAAPTARN